MVKDEKCCNEDENKNPSHKSELTRINRVIGQLEGIKRMINDDRYCLDILTQLMASRSAIRSVSGNILKCHMRSCVSQSFLSEEERDEKIDEIHNLFNKFDG